MIIGFSVSTLVERHKSTNMLDNKVV